MDENTLSDRFIGEATGKETGRVHHISLELVPNGCESVIILVKLAKECP